MNPSLHRRGFLTVTAAGLLASRLRAGPARPNIVLIVGEGLGWTSSGVPMDDRLPASRGQQVQTPALQRLAANGLRFARGYAASPRCTPSRAALLTGISPARLHMTFINEDGVEERDGTAGRSTKLLPPSCVLQLPTTTPTTGSLLRSAGYATAHFGKWHVGEVDPRQHGFDEADGANGNRGPERTANPNPQQVGAITRLGLDFIKRQAAAGKPFFLNLCHYSSRQPADVLPASLAAVQARGVDQREAAGIAGVEELDATIGEVLDQLQALGIAEQTYVVYTTDHGTPGRNSPLRGGKGGCWEGGLRVPFLIAGPGVARGACCHQMVSGLDLLPTFAAWAGATAPLAAEVEGGDLTPLLATGQGTVKRSREGLGIHFPAYDKDPLGPSSAYLHGDWKVLRHDEHPQPKLYNLATDLGEQHDLAAAEPARTQDLVGRLDAWLEAVGAQRTRPNPHYDPTQATAPATGQGGGQGGRRGGRTGGQP
ncbi:MAG: sulfatase-like hydrolase/transferase [Fimbriimonadaceae bacterium]|nr:sulfatase-like hydrolase/transferase [Fimbriimonadaceae bacterium]